MHEPLALFVQEQTTWPIGLQPPKDPQPNSEGRTLIDDPTAGRRALKQRAHSTPYYIEVRREGEKSNRHSNQMT